MRAYGAVHDWRYHSFYFPVPFRIQVTGVPNTHINAFGEELLIMPSAARGSLQNKTGAIIRDYTAGPICFNGDECGAHEWIIEFERNRRSFERFVDILDLKPRAV